MQRRIKKRLHSILQASEPGDTVSRWFDIGIMSLIAANVAAVILETVPELEAAYGDWFHSFELFSVVVFTVEYVMRVWTATEDERYSRPIRGRLLFILSPLALIDLAAILPFYVPMVIPIDLRFGRALRLFRLFRLFKFSRYARSMQLFGRVFTNRKEQITIAMFTVFVMLVLSSSAMYYVENAAQPEHFSSIPETMWWGVATLTTVGYGDVYPVTALGRLLGGLIAVLGIGIFALPTSILASGFAEALEEHRTPLDVTRTCPNCGHRIS